MRLVFDTEWDGFKEVATQMWCLVAKDIDTGSVRKFYPGLDLSCSDYADPKDWIDAALQYLNRADMLIGHNIIDYDFEVLKKVYKWTPSIGTIVHDTVIQSRLQKPDRARPRVGGDGKPHSLASWGARVGMGKPDHTDWTQFSPAMLERCVYDVEINHLTYNYLETERESTGCNWTDSLRTEHASARRIAQQELNGVPFNSEMAQELKDTIQVEIISIDDRLVPALPRVPLTKSKQPNRPVKQFKKDGTPTVAALKYYGDDFTTYREDIIVKTEPMNLASPDQVKKYLLSIGWVPTEYNYKKDPSTGKPMRDERGNKIKTSPKLTEESLESVEWTDGQEEFGSQIVRRLMLAHRHSMLKGFLRDVREDGRLSAKALPLGTPTGRMTHRVVVNVPGKDKPFGEELRSLFGSAPGYVRVGGDLRSCQIYALCHHMPDEGYREANRTGDSHVYIQKMGGLDTRTKGKKLHYTTLFGGGAPKISEDLKISKVKAAQVKKLFFANVPELPALIKKLEREWKRNGFIRGLDGRAIYVRSKHMLLNYLLQSDEAIVIKNFMCKLMDEADSLGLDYQLVTTMHDEVQFLVREGQQTLFTELAHQAIKYVNEKFNLEFYQEIDVTVGETWWDCH